ncbi:hypothetical protein BRARA_F03581 [Brassica rapa]|uniref:Pectinesterase inhibitor domain-containing protein n=1 Tax=Brassica campestris TaxID=3711 RepID=A0A397Z4D7_BRACM|nr:hypothetical protein BRARA_F03581 [Brassica rapa]
MFTLRREDNSETTMMYFFFFVFLFNSCTANKVADSLIQKSCKKITKFLNKDSDSIFEKDCVASLRENPESQKVRNIDELTVVGANNAISNLTNVRRIVENIIKEKKYKSRLSKKLLEDCLKLYSKSFKSLTSGLNYCKVRNFEKAATNFTDAQDAPIFCGIKFNGDNKQISPVKKENDFLITMIEIPLQFAADITHSH